MQCLDWNFKVNVYHVLSNYVRFKKHQQRGSDRAYTLLFSELKKQWCFLPCGGGENYGALDSVRKKRMYSFQQDTQLSNLSKAQTWMHVNLNCHVLPWTGPPSSLEFTGLLGRGREGGRERGGWRARKWDRERERVHSSPPLCPKIPISP